MTSHYVVDQEGKLDEEANREVINSPVFEEEFTPNAAYETVKMVLHNSVAFTEGKSYSTDALEVAECLRDASDLAFAYHFVHGCQNVDTLYLFATPMVDELIESKGYAKHKSVVYSSAASSKDILHMYQSLISGQAYVDKIKVDVREEDKDDDADHDSGIATEHASFDA